MRTTTFTLWQAEPSDCASLLGFSIHAPYDIHPFHDPAWMVISGHCERVGLGPTAPGTGKAYIRGAGYDNPSRTTQVELLLAMGPARLAPGQPYDWTLPCRPKIITEKKQPVTSPLPFWRKRSGGRADTQGARQAGRSIGRRWTGAWQANPQLLTASTCRRRPLPKSSTTAMTASCTMSCARKCLQNSGPPCLGYASEVPAMPAPRPANDELIRRRVRTLRRTSRRAPASQNRGPASRVRILPAGRHAVDW